MGKWASIQGHRLLETVVTLEKGSTQRIELTASNDCTGSFTLALTRNLPDRSGMEETDRQSTVCGQHHHFLPAVRVDYDLPNDDADTDLAAPCI